MMRVAGRGLRKVVVTILGALVFIAGLVMLVMPGPGLLAMAAGLAILATEHEWAHDHLHRVRARAHQVSQAATESTLRTVLSILSGIVLLGLGVGALARPDLVPGDAGIATGVGLCAGALFVIGGTIFGYREQRAENLRRAARPQTENLPDTRLQEADRSDVER